MEVLLNKLFDKHSEGYGVYDRENLIKDICKELQALQLLQTDVIKSVCEIEKEFEGCPLFKQYDNGCYGCKYRKQTVL